MSLPLNFSQLLFCHLNIAIDPDLYLGTSSLQHSQKIDGIWEADQVSEDQLFDKVGEMEM